MEKDWSPFCEDLLDEVVQPAMADSAPIQWLFTYDEEEDTVFMRLHPLLIEQVGGDQDGLQGIGAFELCVSSILEKLGRRRTSVHFCLDVADGVEIEGGNPPTMRGPCLFVEGVFKGQKVVLSFMTVPAAGAKVEAHRYPNGMCQMIEDVERPLDDDRS